MQAIIETLFDVVYLTLVIAIGITMIIRSKQNKQYRLFGTQGKYSWNEVE